MDGCELGEKLKKLSISFKNKKVLKRTGNLLRFSRILSEFLQFHTYKISRSIQKMKAIEFIE